MQITITKDFNTVEEALAFLARLDGRQSVVQAAISPLPGLVIAPEQPAPEPEKKARKPRADAGKVRGAYKPRDDARAVEGAEHLNVKPEGAGAPAGVGVVATAEKLTPPAENPAVEPSQAAQAPAAAAAPLTIDDLRATMKRLHDTPGKGTDACIQALREFGVLRISEVPAAKFIEFHQHLLAQLPAAK